MTPIIDELSSEYSDADVVIGKVNVDDNPEISAKFKIRSIPTLLFINVNGEVSEIMVGAQSKSKIVEKLDVILKKDVK